MPAAWEWLDEALSGGDAAPPLPGPSPAVRARHVGARRKGEEGIDVLLDMASHSLRAVGALQATLSAKQKGQGGAGSRLGASQGVLGRIAAIAIKRGGSWKRVVGNMSGVCRSWRGALRETMQVGRVLPIAAGGGVGAGGGAWGTHHGAERGREEATGGEPGASPSTSSLLEQIHNQQSQHQPSRRSSSPQRNNTVLPPPHPTAQAAQAAAAAGGRGMAAMSKISKGLLNMVASDDSAKRGASCAEVERCMRQDTCPVACGNVGCFSRRLSSLSTASWPSTAR